jgi:hypothetical protein
MMEASMKPGDLMMLGEEAILYDREGTGRYNVCKLGEIVTIIREPHPGAAVLVLHPTHGLRDVFAHDLHPMTGGEQ